MREASGYQICSALTPIFVVWILTSGLISRKILKGAGQKAQGDNHTVQEAGKMLHANHDVIVFLIKRDIKHAEDVVWGSDFVTGGIAGLKRTHKRISLKNLTDIIKIINA